MFLNKRAQASSSFNLLIGVIVTIALLAFVVPFFQDLMNKNRNDDIVGIAAEGIALMKGSPGQHFFSKKSIVFPAGAFLTAEMISNERQVGLKKEDICVSAGDFMNDKYWKQGKDADGSFIQNNRSFGVKVKYSIFCDTKANFKASETPCSGLKTSFERFTCPPANFRKQWITHCEINTGLPFNDPNNTLVCMLALRFSN